MVFKSYERDATIRWYDSHSDRYDDETFQQDADNYGGDLYRIELIRTLLAEHRPRRVLDVGCGTAQPMLRLLQDGFDIRGFDFSPGMIAAAKRKLRSNGYDESLAEVGDLLDPGIVARYGAEGYDAVVANGVLPYIPDHDLAHRHLSALVRPGGLYISAYSNALLDLVTMNRFTVRFHREQFLAPLDLTDQERAMTESALAGLMHHPDKPVRIGKGARDDVYIGADNPLSIGAELARYGLQQFDLLFYKFHAFPPLLKDLQPALKPAFMRNSRAYELKRARDWRGYFLASTFIVVCRKLGETRS